MDWIKQLLGAVDQQKVLQFPLREPTANRGTILQQMKDLEDEARAREVLKDAEGAASLRRRAQLLSIELPGATDRVPLRTSTSGIRG